MTDDGGSIGPRASSLRSSLRPDGGSQAVAPWRGTLRAVIALAEANDVRELEVRSGSLRIALRRITSVETPAGNSIVGPRAHTTVAEDEHTHLIRSPLTGVWYDSPSPGAPPFVRIGDRVDVGSPVGVIETMKIFNEVASDAPGRVSQIRVHAGDLVQMDAPIIALDLTEAPIPAQAIDQ